FSVQLGGKSSGPHEPQWTVKIDDLRRLVGEGGEDAPQARDSDLQEYFTSAKRALADAGVEEVEIFGCNAGKDTEGARLLASLLGVKVRLYTQFTGTDGETTSLHRERDGPATKGTTTTGLPSETAAGAKRSVVAEPPSLRKN